MIFFHYVRVLGKSLILEHTGNLWTNVADIWTYCTRILFLSQNASAQTILGTGIFLFKMK
jgi:hypothetical protein